MYEIVINTSHNINPNDEEYIISDLEDFLRKFSEYAPSYNFKIKSESLFVRFPKMYNKDREE